MPKHTFGLANVEMGAIAGDGGMGTSLVAVGETVSDTAIVSSEDNTVTDFTVEESDSPVESIVSARGKLTFAWSTFNVEADNLVKFFGGTKVTGPPVKWQAPDAFPDIEQSLKLTDKKGNVVEIPRAKLSPKFGLSFQKTKLGQVDIVATVLQPTKAGEKRITITYV
jgi:hypothetical protein